MSLDVETIFIPTESKEEYIAFNLEASVSAENISLDVNHDKKIKKLEKTIAELSKTHSISINGLHAEIQRLSNRISGTRLCAIQMLLQNALSEMPRTTKVSEKMGVSVLVQKDAIITKDLALNLAKIESESETQTISSPTVKKVNNETNATSKITAHQLFDENNEKEQVPENNQTVQKAQDRPDNSPIIQNQVEQVISHPVGQSEEFQNVHPSRQVTATSIQETMTESIYLLVQKEKKKYNALVERSNEDKKRRLLEYEGIKNEMKVLKAVLKLAGLSCDINDYKEILNAHHEAPRPVTPISVLVASDALRPSSTSGDKKLILPPITLGEKHPFEDLEELIIKDIDEKKIETKPFSPAIAKPPPNALNAPHPSRKNRYKTGVTLEKESFDFEALIEKSNLTSGSGNLITIPALLEHNQNLDYNSRAHMYLDRAGYEISKPAPQDSAITQSKSITQSPEFPRLFSKELPPLNEETKKTTHADRMWRSRLVRSKIMKGLEKGF